MKRSILITCLVLSFVTTRAKPPVKTAGTSDSLLNKLCPEFSFDTLFNYKKDRLALSDFKGKFVIVDFWGTFCLPCIADFPKLEALQTKFADSLQILLVATDGAEKAKRFYDARNNTNKAMVLPCAVNKKMVNYFKLLFVSTYVWIDDKGYIKAITDDSQLTEQNVADFVGRKKLTVRQVSEDVLLKPHQRIVTKADEIDTSNVVFSSSFTKHLRGFSPRQQLMRWGHDRKVYTVNLPIRNLYQIAYGDSSGTVKFNRTVIESEHPERVARPRDDDYGVWKLEHTYSYELVVPEEKKHQLQQLMQEDLKKYFGYNAHFEERVQKCLVLTGKKDARMLAAKAVTPKMVFNTGGISCINYPFKQFFEMLFHYNQEKIMIDDTGITDNVAITLQAQMNDIDDLNKALKAYGLSLHYEDRKVRMFIISDPVKQ